MIMFTAKLFIIVTAVLSCIPLYGGMEAKLTASPIDFGGTSCRPFHMECVVENLETLSWFFDGKRVGMPFGYEASTSYPHNIYSTRGVEIDVLKAVAESPQSDIFNATSVLRTNTLALSLKNVSEIQCGTRNVESPSFDLSQLDLHVSPTVECSLSSSFGALSVSIRWFPFFTSQHAVERYHVSVSPDPSSCSSDQVNPSQVYTCSGLQPLTMYSFTVSAAVSCANTIQEGQTNTFVVHLQAPQVTLSIISMLPTYDQNLTLSEVFVQWDTEYHISENCTIRKLNYSVVLKDAISGTIVQEKIVSSDMCNNSLCNATFSDFETKDSQYNVFLTVKNDSGFLSNNFTSNKVAGSFMDTISIAFTTSNCSTSLICASPDKNGSCTIQYSQDAFYQNISLPLHTTVNSVLSLPLLESNAVYYYILMINLTASFRVKGNFNSGPLASKLTETNQGLVIMGVILSTIAAIIALVLCGVDIKSRKGFRFVLLLAGIVLIVVCVVQWIAVCAVVIPQDDTCDSSWQFRRSNLIITAFVFSLFAAIALVACAIKFSIGNNNEHSTIIETDLGSEDSQVRGAGGRFEVIEERPLFDEFVPQGKNISHRDQYLQKREEEHKKMEAAMTNLDPEDLQKRGAGERFKVVEERPLVDEFAPQGKTISHKDQYLQIREEDHKKMEAKMIVPSEGGELQEQQYSSLKHGPVKKSSDFKSGKVWIFAKRRPKSADT